MLQLSVYLGLFLSALGSATLLPMQSEAVLVGLILNGGYSLSLLLLVASVGNILGAVINWLLGRYLEHFRQRRWFPLKQARLEQAQGWYQHYGHWSLLLSWVPIIGDPLTLVAGVMGEPLWRFVLLVTVAKVGRYMVLAWLTLGWM